jgi:hypothetical protein
MNKLLWVQASALVLLISMAVTPVHAQAVPPSPLALTNAIELSSAYLISQLKRNGMFEYLENMNPDVDDQGGYNILRHAGAIYALAMGYRLNPGKEVLRAMIRSGQYLHIEAIAPVPGRNDMLAVWSRPEVNQQSDTLEAKLGGNGLGLVALLSIEEHAPGFTPREALRKLGAFILFMQKEDGGFYATYAPAKGGYQQDVISLYYPGEAALGLLMLYKRDPQNAWLESATMALNYLARTRADSDDVPADHWALLATANLFALAGEKLPPTEKALLLKHATQVAQAIIAEQVTSTKAPSLNGGFTADGRTTPAATRLEGLLAALTFLPEDDPNYERIENAIHRGMAFLLRAQVSRGEFAGAFPRSVARIHPQIDGAEEFNQRATEIRVDYVQHALCAMVQYRDLITSKAQ